MRDGTYNFILLYERFICWSDTLCKKSALFIVYNFPRIVSEKSKP